MGLADFRFPQRDSDIWFGDQDMDDDDKAASLEFNQLSLEDYLSNQLPQVFIQQASLGSGTIDPAQLATGTAGTGKAPVSAGASAPAWTDIVTQAEGDAGFGGSYTQAADIQRGRVTVDALDGTNTVFSFAFSSTFVAVPRVVTQVECGRGVALFPTLTIVNTTSVVGFVTGLSSTTATCFVHWHAIKA